MNENYTKHIIEEGVAVEMLFSKFVVVIEIMIKHCWGLFLLRPPVDVIKCSKTNFKTVKHIKLQRKRNYVNVS